MIEKIRAFSADPRLTGIPWLLVRFLLAFQWISAGWKKVTDPMWVGPQAPQALHKFLMGSLAPDKTTGPQPAVFGWYADWIRNVALPNELWYSTLVSYGELLVGIALLLGVFTKGSAFLAAGMNLNYIFAGSANANGYMLAAESAMVFAGLGVAYYGVDHWLLPALGRLLTGGRPTATPAATAPPPLPGMAIPTPPAARPRTAKVPR